MGEKGRRNTWVISHLLLRLEFKTFFPRVRNSGKLDPNVNMKVGLLLLMTHMGDFSCGYHIWTKIIFKLFTFWKKEPISDMIFHLSRNIFKGLTLTHLSFPPTTRLSQTSIKLYKNHRKFLSSEKKISLALVIAAICQLEITVFLPNYLCPAWKVPYAKTEREEREKAFL